MIVCDRCERKAGFQIDVISVRLHSSSGVQEHRLWEKGIDLCPGCFEEMKRHVIEYITDKLPKCHKP